MDAPTTPLPDPVTSYLATYGGPGKPVAAPPPPPKTVPLLAAQDLAQGDPVTSYLQKYGKAAAPERGSVADAIAQAISPFGLSDELGGVMSAAGKALHGDFNFGKNYKAAQEQYQGDAESYAHNHPTANNFIQAAGSIVPAATAALATGGGSLPAEAAPLWARMAGGAAAGAGAEQAQRIGTAHGSIMDRLGAAQSQGLPLAGMIFGGAAPAVPAAASSIMDRLKGTPGDAKALGVVTSAIQKSGKTPEEVIQNLRNAPADVPVMLADEMGDPGRRLVRNVSDINSLNAADLARQLKDRNDTQFTRWVANTQKNSGVPFQSVDEAIDAFKKARTEASNAAFGAADMDQVHTGPALQAAMKDPSFQKAIKIGGGITNTNDITRSIKGTAPTDAPISHEVPVIQGASPIAAANPQLYQRLVDLNNGDHEIADQAMRSLGYSESGAPSGAAESNPGVTLSTLDNARQYLRKGIQSGFDAQSGFNHTSARSTQGLLNAVLDEVKTKNPEYGKALEQYGDMSKPLNAIDAAEGFWHRTPKENAYNMAKVPAEGMDAFRIKAMADAEKKMGDASDPRNLMSIWGNGPNARGNLSLFAPTPEAAGNMQNFRDWENKGALVHSALGGSQTSTNVMGASDLGHIAGPRSIAQALARPNRAGIRIAGAVGGAIEKHQARTLSDALAPILGTTRDQLPSLEARLLTARKNAMLRDQAGRVISLQAGMESGNNNQP